MKLIKYNCYMCKELKPKEDFCKDSTKKYGIRYMCKPCSKEYRIKHSEKIREGGRKYRQKLKAEVMAKYSNGETKCLRCGFADIRALCIDHVEDNGAEHYKQIGGVGKLYSWLRLNNFPSGFQVLCMNCNFIKEVESGHMSTKLGLRKGKLKDKIKVKI